MIKLLNNVTPLRVEAPEWYPDLAKRDIHKESKEKTKIYNESIYSYCKETTQDDTATEKGENKEE